MCDLPLSAVGLLSAKTLDKDQNWWKQVSVRKAALGAACGLLRALPEQAPLCALWVGAALPLVREVEAPLQEALLDSCQEFLIAPAGACMRAQPCPRLPGPRGP